MQTGQDRGVAPELSVAGQGMRFERGVLMGTGRCAGPCAQTATAGLCSAGFAACGGAGRGAQGHKGELAAGGKQQPGAHGLHARQAE